MPRWSRRCPGFCSEARRDDEPSLKDAWESWLAYHDFRSFMLIGDPALIVPRS